MSGLVLRRFFGFIAIGLLGFSVEAVIIYFATAQRFDLSPTAARMFSFPCAVLLTWFLNRKYNFRSTNIALSEGGRYLATQSIGGVTNFVVFTLIVAVYPFLATWPILALGLGAVAGLTVNFTMSYFYVFKKRLS